MLNFEKEEAKLHDGLPEHVKKILCRKKLLS
jgi:hypothetical protein